MRYHGHFITRGLWAGCLVFLTLTSVQAQQQYPTPMLSRVAPCGGKAGTTVEVTLFGNHLEEVKSLQFSQAGFKATLIPPPPPKDPKKPTPPGPPKLNIEIPANMKAGSYEVRAVGKWGVTNPRIFVVSNLNEIAEKETNNDVAQAQAIEMNTVINGVIQQNIDIDYFSFQGKKGQRILLHCAAFSIDSRLTPLLQLYNSDGKLLATNTRYSNRDALLDATLPEDGGYLVRLGEFTHQFGSNDYFYRLTVSQTPWIDAVFPPVVAPGKPANVTLVGRNLPGGKTDPTMTIDGQTLETLQVNIPAQPADPTGLNIEDPMMPRTASVDGFQYQIKNGAGVSNSVLLSYAMAPIIKDNGDNNTSEKAQAIPLPVDVCGRIEKKRDKDRYVFEAKKGDVWIIEGIADRLGSPVDLYFRIVRLDNKQTIGEYDDNPNIPTQAGEVFTRTEDPETKFTAPVDGKYEILVSSRTAGISAGPKHIYRISIRKEKPDYRLLLVGNTDGSAGGLTLRQGSHQDLQVVCLRQDGFNGEVKLQVEGLPAGVTCPPQVIGPKQKDMRLVLSAAEGAAEWTGPIKIKGTAIVDGQPVTHEARTGCLVWPSPQNTPSISRLSQSLVLAVRNKGLYALEPEKPEMEVCIGNRLTFKLKMKKYAGDLKGNVQCTRLSVPVLTNGNVLNFPNVNVPVAKGEGVVNANIPTSAEPGTYNIVYQGLLQYQFQKDPKNKRKQNIRVRAVSSPMRLTIYNQVAEVSLSAPSVQVKAGGQTPVTVRVKRLHGYDGEFTVQLVLPGGFRGISASTVKIPKGKNEVQLMLKSPANTKAASNPDFEARVTSRVGSANLTHSAKFEVKIVQ